MCPVRGFTAVDGESRIDAREKKNRKKVRTKRTRTIKCRLTSIDYALLYCIVVLHCCIALLYYIVVLHCCIALLYCIDNYNEHEIDSKLK